jgi:hypothetical protein
LRDAGAAYPCAPARGATSLIEPNTAAYGDGTAAAIDAFGNHCYQGTFPGEKTGD